MKLYTSIGPNPRVVNMFLAEKGMEVPTQQVDLMGGENRGEEYTKNVNAAGQSPALQLDDGQVVAEITAICEYLEEQQPEPALIGGNAAERAETRMWTRRVDLNICEPMANGFRFSQGLPLFESRMRCLPDAAEGLKACAQDKLTWLDELMDGREFLAGDRFTLADIHLYCFLHFGASVGQPLNEENQNIRSWFERIDARESAKATDIPVG